MFRTAIAIFCLVSVLTTMSVPARSQTTKSDPLVTPDPQAISLLTQCAATMGSLDPLSTFQGSARIIPAHKDEPESELLLRSKGSEQIRWDRTSSRGQETIVIQAGGGSVTRGQEEYRLAPWQTAYPRAEHFPALLCSAESQRSGMQISYVGLEDVGSSQAHHIQISAAGRGRSEKADALERLASEFHIFVDAQSLVVVKTRRFAFSPDAIENRSDLETYYSDYRPVNGVLMPFTVTTFLAGQKLQDVVFGTIQLGVTLSNADFGN